MTFFPRNPLSEENATQVAAAVQPVLVTLIDLALVGKQAHWAVFGTQFLAVHEKLDAVVDTARSASDTLAERMAQLGVCPDGRVQTVAKESPLPNYPADFTSVPETLTLVCDRLKMAIETLRNALSKVDDPDPMTGDYLIAIGQELEEHLWMLQAMEKNDG